MTTTHPIGDSEYADYSDHTLATTIMGCQANLDTLHRQVDRMKQELQNRIEGKGATMLADPEFSIELKQGVATFDAGIMVALKEELGESDLAKVLTPAHLETVPEKWDGQQANAMARRYGGKVSEIVTKARIPGKPKLVVSRK